MASWASAALATSSTCRVRPSDRSNRSLPRRCCRDRADRAPLLLHPQSPVMYGPVLPISGQMSTECPVPRPPGQVAQV